MKTVYFVRHGESEANVGHPVFQGEESDLTPRGEEQARFIADRAKNLQFEALISSRALRARKTADYISQATGVKHEPVEIFSERKLPSRFVGIPVDDEDVRPKFEAWEKSLYEPDVRVEDGENFSDITKRAGGALAYLEKRSESYILVVTHGFFLRTIIARVLFGEKVTPDELKKIIATFRTANTGLTLMQFGVGDSREAWGIPKNPWIIRVWNDHAHLG